MKSVSLDGKEFFPSKIICIGRNYVAHIRELGNEIPKEPVIFIKPNSAISAEIHSGESDEIHFEGEICIVINEGELAAVGFGLDLTKRQLQSSLKAKGLPWERSKAFDGAAVFSEFVTFDGQVNDLRLELHINDCLVQQGGCELMMYKPDEIIVEVKSFLSLEDGDLIMTGTPAGVGPLYIGDRFTGKIFAGEKLIVKGSWVVQ
ncbi:MAG: fumarylacetoacetate hydrolase family protein [Xanthomonadales bacterium]|nr:fumarylacetoacetate hydrolase family protein [Xanthomonadales bacterium]